MAAIPHDAQQPVDYSGIVEKSTHATQSRDLPVKIEKLSYEMGKAPIIVRLFHKLGISDEARNLKNMQESLTKLNITPPTEDLETVLTESKQALKNIQEEIQQLGKPYLEKYTDKETKRYGDLGQQARELEKNIGELEKLVAQSKEGPEILARLKEKRHDIKQMKVAANSTPIGRIMLAVGIGKDAQKIQEQRMLKQQLYSQAIQQTGSRANAKAATDSTYKLPEGLKMARYPDGQLYVAQKNKDGEWIDKYTARYIDGEPNFVDSYSMEELPKHLKNLSYYENTLPAEFNKHEQVSFRVQKGKPNVTSPEMLASFVTDKSKVFTREVEANGVYAKMELQAKGYLPEGEYAADWATIDTIGNMTLAVVADAAGNSKDSHLQVMEDTARFKSTLMRELGGKTRLTPDAIGRALGVAIRETELQRTGLSSTVGSEAWNSRDLKSRPH